ncbi:hypothetical protein KOW79_014065 [Hemibagrus wyckioides]|uniref:Uncharacterized protein n=1 Tax=Hemibagrus wyckioides TaxID=337641 RepID=A0A9D3NHY9_9TELE|nr:hypothetical protein KOW79_014065 [Hemibagrus wyckioides]
MDIRRELLCDAKWKEQASVRSRPCIGLVNSTRLVFLLLAGGVNVVHELSADWAESLCRRICRKTRGGKKNNASSLV